jgi:F-type H+-transporting ATPase subunit delta
MKFGLQTTLFKKISRRYSQSLFNAAIDANILEPIQLDFILLSRMLSGSTDFRDFINAPYLQLFPNREILCDLLKAHVHPLTLDFLTLLCHKNRLNLLKEIIESFEALYHHHFGITKVSIISAAPLAPSQVDAICKKLKNRWNRGIFAETIIDPELIGGFQIKSGDKILDLSLKNQLAKYRHAVLNA